MPKRKTVRTPEEEIEYQRLLKERKKESMHTKCAYNIQWDVTKINQDITNKDLQSYRVAVPSNDNELRKVDTDSQSLSSAITDEYETNISEKNEKKKW